MDKDQTNGDTENITERAKQTLARGAGAKAREAESTLERAADSIKKAIGQLKHSIAKRLDK
jgi:hypothetical protein